jgi:hypothetical protein
MQVDGVSAPTKVRFRFSVSFASADSAFAALRELQELFSPLLSHKGQS